MCCSVRCNICCSVCCKAWVSRADACVQRSSHPSPSWLARPSCTHIHTLVHTSHAARRANHVAMNESCHLWMCRVIYDCVDVTYEWVTWHTHESLYGPSRMHTCHFHATWGSKRPLVPPTHCKTNLGNGIPGQWHRGRPRCLQHIVKHTLQHIPGWWRWGRPRLSTNTPCPAYSHTHVFRISFNSKLQCVLRSVLWCVRSSVYWICVTCTKVKDLVIFEKILVASVEHLGFYCRILGIIPDVPWLVYTCDMTHS